METVIFDQSPLAEYLKNEGEEQQHDWAPPAAAAEPEQPATNVDTPPPSPSFAPVGRPLVKARFRNKNPGALRVEVPRSTSLSASMQNSLPRAVASTLDRADTSKFLEQFRYTIVASQLLSGHSVPGQHHLPAAAETSQVAGHGAQMPTGAGVIITAAGALVLAWVISWVYAGGVSNLTKKRVLFGIALFVFIVFVSQAYVRQRWMRHMRDQALSEVATFVSRSQDFDSATGAAITLVAEVEVVSRGYRLSAPMPPISRIEDRSQTRRCVRLRKVLKACLSDAIHRYTEASDVIKGLAEQLDLEKYYDIYDISDYDISDARQGFSEAEFEDPESLHTLKLVAARFHVLRKVLLCAMLALETGEGESDLVRWTAVVEGLRSLGEVTKTSYERLRDILSDGDSFPVVPPPLVPLSPGRERWRSQLRKLNALSTGIRGLQAKMALLREESDKSLNEADDVSELGPNLMAQYESIGQDLRMLTQAWEEGKAALASGIDRNEKRLSSISSVLSPASSLSGVTTVDEGGGALEALRALNGETPSKSSIDYPAALREPDPEVFEAVAKPRPRSLLPREERIARMKEDRERREAAREQTDSHRGMLRELEMVMNLRPQRSNTASSARSSL